MYETRTMSDAENRAADREIYSQNEQRDAIKQLSEAAQKILDSKNPSNAEIKTANRYLDRVENLRSQTDSGLSSIAQDGGFDFPSNTEKRGIYRPDQDGFRNFGDFLQSVRNSYVSPGFKDSRLERRATGMNESIPSEGGFLVGEQYEQDLLQKIYMDSQILQRVRRYEISGNANSIKIPGVDESSRQDGQRQGGVRGYWTDEAATMTGSKPSLYQVQLTLNKLTALIYTSDSLLQDAPALGAYVQEMATRELQFKAVDAIISGNGSGKPLGILNSPCLVTISEETSQPADTIYPENIMKMYARVWNSSKKKGVWICNPDCLEQLMSMQIAGGTSSSPVWLPANSLAGRPFDTLLGQPIIWAEQASTVGDVGDIIFADLSEYLLAEKAGIQSASSIHLKFLENESAFRFTWRLDGNVSWQSAVTPFKGSNTMSPFVVVETR